MNPPAAARPRTGIAALRTGRDRVLAIRRSRSRARSMIEEETTAFRFKIVFAAREDARPPWAGSQSLQPNQTAPGRICNSFCTADDVHLGEYGFPVRLDGTFTNEEG